MNYNWKKWRYNGQLSRHEHLVRAQERARAQIHELQKSWKISLNNQKQIKYYTAEALLVLETGQGARPVPFTKFFTVD